MRNNLEANLNKIQYSQNTSTDGMHFGIAPSDNLVIMLATEQDAPCTRYHSCDAKFRGQDPIQFGQML
jgi:hypothetical protein